MTVRLSRILPATALVALTLSWDGSNASSQTPAPRTVLVILWSAESYPTNPVVEAAIRKTLLSDRGPTVEYFVEHLESDIFPEELASSALHDYIRRKYKGRRIDVVIAVADSVLQFALRHRDELFPDAPIVYSGVSAVDETTSETGAGVTGITSAGGYGDSLRLALTTHPSTKRVFVVLKTVDVRQADPVQMELRDAAGQVELTYSEQKSLPDLLAAVKALPAGTLVLYIRYSQDPPQRVVYPAEVAKLVGAASPVPVYGISDTYLGSGVVGGVMYSSARIGADLGELTLKILDGVRAHTIPIARTATAPTFDWRQLRRWGIAERSLPPGSVVMFREISVWERYRVAIGVAVGVIVLQSALIAALVLERRRRRRAEVDSRRHLAAMAHLDRRAAMGELTTSLAHELNQPLNAILQNAGVAQMLLASTTVPPALQEMGEIIGDIRRDDIRASEVIRRMRGLLQKHELEAHPVDLNEVAEETVAIVRPDALARRIELELELAKGVRPTIGDRVHLQQVVLNLWRNAADAVASQPPARRHVRVRTEQSDGEVRLAVEDTGVGIPAERLAKIFEPFYTTKGEGSGMGMGLAIARSIVEAHAGRIAAENNAGGGATVWFSLPTSSGPPS
jgi:signal transduction histidine kinase